MLESKEPKWLKSLGEVLEVESKTVEVLSEKTGNTYKKEIIENYEGLFTGIAGDIDEKTNTRPYTIINVQTGYITKIKSRALTNVPPMSTLVFTNLQGGLIDGKTPWFKADDVYIKNSTATPTETPKATTSAPKQVMKKTL